MSLRHSCAIESDHYKHCLFHILHILANFLKIAFKSFFYSAFFCRSSVMSGT